MNEQEKMKLEIGNFCVKNIVFGEKTTYEDGILTVNRDEAIEALNPGGKLKNVELHIAFPGERTRILPVKAVVEPRARADGRAAFPGYSGGIAPCGYGRLYALKNMAVTAVGRYGGWMEGILDMSGPMAERVYYSRLIHLCFTADNVDPSEDGAGQHMNVDYRLGAHLLAEYVAKAALGRQPDEWENCELPDVSDKKLPKVVLVIMLSTFYDKKDGFDDVVYGVDVRLMLPTLLHPNELLDGAVCTGSLMPAGQRFYTYTYQNFPMLKKLYAEHGKTIDFAGVIISDIGQTVLRKERSAIRVAEIARTLRCDGAIYVEQGNGNPDVDLFKTIIALENMGIKTVGMCNEAPGRDGTTQVKAMLDARGDAVVVTGNADQVIELPAMGRIIGDLGSISRDRYPGCWNEDAHYGPSLRPDGSIIMDAHSFVDNDGCCGWSNKTMMSY